VAFAYTLGALTDNVLRQLRGTTRDKVNILSQALDAPAALTVETIYLTGDTTGVTIGSILVVGQESMYVLSVTPASLTASVIRGYEDTTPATAAAGTLVQVDPPWTRSVIQDRIREELRSWAPQVYAVAEIEIPLVDWQRGYDLGAITRPIIRILKVTAPEPPYMGTPGDWTGEGVSDTTMLNPTLKFRYDPNANLVEFPSGKAVILTDGWTPRAIGNLHIVYATPFDVDTSWTETTDMIASVGMNEMDLDIPAIGAAARLLRMSSVRRALLNVEGQSRDDQNVRMADILQAAQQFELEARMRRSDAQQRLLSDFPYRSSNY
jgi:hypothetical protein